MPSSDEAITWPPGSPEEVSLWLNARLDGECTPSQEGWLSEYVRAHPDAAAEWAVLQRTRFALEAARLKEPSDLEREALARALAPSLLSWLGWGLFLAGALTLGAFVAVEVARDSETPLVALAGLGALAAGLLALLARVGWERWRVRKHDPYRSVLR